jgi:hypothetical protein
VNTAACSAPTGPVGALLCAPASCTVPPGTLDHVRARLVEGVARATAGAAGDAAGGAAGGAAGDRRTEVGLPQLRRARYRPERLGRPDGPFRWKPAFVRRSLGIAAVRACATGQFRGPADAVGPLADRAVEEWRRSGWRTFHWEPWFAGLGPGGRASVLGEAACWASPVWGALDWARLGPAAELGRPDDRWTVPGADAVRLRGRSEARVAVAGSDGRRSGVAALLSVACGCPGDGWRDELAFLALVAGLAAPSLPVPVRAVGLWPESGDLRAVEIDAAALGGAADRVIATVAAVTVVAVTDAAVTGRTAVVAAGA